MTWTPLAPRISDCPHILAGPVLRRVTPTSVSVWLVLRSPATATLSIYASDSATEPLFTCAPVTVAKVGVSLYVTVLTARTTTPLQRGQVYYYDLWFFFDGESQPRSLAQAVGTSELTYGGQRRPSFSLPPASREALRLFHASCRRPGSSNSRDALMIVGDLIASSLDEPDGRPHQLFLTGDQIYADSMPDALLLMISDAASRLVGDETLPFDDLSSVAVLPPPNARSSLIKKQARLTTSATSSHLLTFGEYVLMYVVVWSDVLWRDGLPSYEDLPAQSVPEGDGARRRHRKDFDLDHAALLDFWPLVSFVRKTLANVPTYMILDDHEVTDDWNLDQAWCEAVYGAALGRRIVTNAMLAYSLCQHWGNTPEQFEVGAGAELLTLLAHGTVHASPRTATILGLHDKEQLRSHATETGTFSLFHDAPTSGASLHEGEPVHSDTLLYHYHVVGPHHLVAVTDTRTWRSYPRGGDGYPDLIDPAELARQLPAASTLGARQLFIVLSTNLAPIPSARWGAHYARSSILRIKKSIRQKFRVVGEFAESWLPGRVDFFRLLAKLARDVVGGSGGVIVLSGDVHYSFSTRIQYWAEQQVDDPPGAPTQANLVIAQFVASATNNRSADSKGIHADGYAYRTSDMRGWIAEHFVPSFSERSEAFFGWTPQVAGGDPAPVQFDRSGGEDPYPHWESDMTADEPSWSSDLPAASTDLRMRFNAPPHYRLRIDNLIAAAGSALPAPFQSDATDPMVVRNDQLYWAGTTIREIAGSEIVGRPNVGEVNLRGAFAEHFVLWREGGGLRWVRFDASLDPLDAFFDKPKYPNE